LLQQRQNLRTLQIDDQFLSSSVARAAERVARPTCGLDIQMCTNDVALVIQHTSTDEFVQCRGGPNQAARFGEETTRCLGAREKVRKELANTDNIAREHVREGEKTHNIATRGEGTEEERVLKRVKVLRETVVERLHHRYQHQTCILILCNDSVSERGDNATLGLFCSQIGTNTITSTRFNVFRTQMIELERLNHMVQLGLQ